MTPVKKTANTKLNQWEKSDRIMMSDFNSDNQKLDAALKSLAGENAALRQSVAALQTQLDTLTARTVPFLLKEITLSQGGSSLVVDLSFIDWAVYDRIIIESKLQTSGNDPYVNFLDSIRNQPICSAYAQNGYVTTPETRKLNRLVLYSHGDKSRPLYAVAVSPVRGDTRTLLNITGADLKGLKLICTDGKTNLSAGCWFRIAGVKA